jgi:hypothetical protein
MVRKRTGKVWTTFGPLVCLPALALGVGCRGVETPAAPPEQSQWNEILPPDAFQGDLMGVDPRARQIERNLGFQ